MSYHDPEPCGTNAAYHRHRYKKEKPCEACRQAHAEYAKRPPAHKREKAAPCGTNAAYMRHKRHEEEPCDACDQAHRAWCKEYREIRRGAPARTPKPCGTVAAYVRHRRRKEPPCEACAKAFKAYARAQYKARYDAWIASKKQQP